MGEIPALIHQKEAFLLTAKSLGTIVRLKAGNDLFREGDEPDYMYVVLSGAIDIESRGKHIERIGMGDALGIVGLVDGLKRTITARVSQDVELALLDKRKFRYMVESVPNCVWYVMAGLVERLRATNAAL